MPQQQVEMMPAVPINTNSKSRLNLIVRVNVVLNRTVVVDNDWRFNNLCGSHLQSQRGQNQAITFEFGLLGLILASLAFSRENNRNEEEEEEEGKQ